MIDQQLKDAINQQVTEEYAAAYTYRHLANEMDALSFPGLCQWFVAQAQEATAQRCRSTWPAGAVFVRPSGEAAPSCGPLATVNA